MRSSPTTARGLPPAPARPFPPTTARFFPPTTGPGPSPAAQGFSLVEVLCALTVLGVAVVGITEGITLSLRMVKEAEYQSVAALLASGRMEIIRADGYFTEGEEEGDFGDDFPLYAWRQSIVAASTPGLYEVTVTVELAASGKQLLELKTLLFKAQSSAYGSTGSLGANASRRGGL